MADNIASQSWPGYSWGNQPATIDDLSKKLDEISASISGKNAKAGGVVPRNPVDIARGEISDIFTQRKVTQKQLGNIWQNYLNKINRGSMDPGEAELAYVDIARASGANMGESLRKASKLGNTPLGFAPASQYQRYMPAAQLATEQLLGRTMSDPEFKNYVSAAQGLGISKGPDFEAFLGKAILSSPEYKSQAVIFDPAKVASGLEAAGVSRKIPSVQEFAAMLG